MEEHVHELLHVAAATLFFLSGASALREYRNLRERVVFTYSAMCLCSGAWACHVIISHNLPKLGAFWMPWTSVGLVATFGATFFYLVTMRRFLGARGRFLWVPLGIQVAVTLCAFADLASFALTRRSLLFLDVPRVVGAHQTELGEGAYSLRPLAEITAGLFGLSFVLGVGYLLVYLIRTRSRDTLVYVGLIVTGCIIANESLVALSVYSGFYLLAFSKAFETVRIHGDIRTRSRERIERRLRQAEKMEAVGRVAGGIAHDFNNVLTVIGGSVDLAADVLDKEHPAHEDLTTAQEGVETGRRLVRQLLDVARSKEAPPETVDVNAFFAEHSKFLASIVQNPVKFELRLEPNIGGVTMPSGQLTQVVMNLLVNAREAMANGGTIELRAGKAIDPGRKHSVSVPSSIVISVRDEGGGIPEDVLEHVFEPFFTTKGGGSGLGLATLYSIVHAAGGHVEVASEEGRGTRFDVILPSSDLGTS